MNSISSPTWPGIMGYSFGGRAALAVGKSCERVRSLAAVSPVITPGLMQGLSIPAYYKFCMEDFLTYLFGNFPL